MRLAVAEGEAAVRIDHEGIEGGLRGSGIGQQDAVEGTHHTGHAERVVVEGGAAGTAVVLRLGVGIGGAEGEGGHAVGIPLQAEAGIDGGGLVDAVVPGVGERTGRTRGEEGLGS